MSTDLKALWNSSEETLVSPDLDKLKSESTNTLTRIKKILSIEYRLNLILSPIFIILLIWQNQWWLALFQASISTAYFVYYTVLIKKIKHFDYSQNVVESLKSTYRYLRFYLLHYKALMWALFPVGGSVAFIWGIYVGYTEAGGKDIFTNYKIWLVFIGTLLLATGLGWLINKLVNLLYGNKINRLKKQIEDFEKN